jgi:enoyl-CoA hydratase/carnithine racemase
MSSRRDRPPIYAELVVDRPTPQIVVAKLNRSSRLNALTPETFKDFVRLQDEVEGDDDVRALIVTGEGRGFCAGLDLDTASSLPAMPASVMLRTQESWSRAVAGFRGLSKPVIAAINGVAAGAGMGIALAADLRIAAPTARFNAAFVKIGLSGGDVGTSYLLPRLVGLGRATEILMTGRFVDADEALTIGLVTQVVEGRALLGEALRIAGVICGNSPTGMELTKHVIRANLDAPSLDAALALENRNQVLATRTIDMVEALTAFREKRPPVFVGH